MKAGRRVLGAGAIVGALMMMPPSGAGASVVKENGFSYVTKVGELPGGYKTLTAKCPGKTHVWSGGHWGSGDFNEGVLSHSFPYDSDDAKKAPDDGWKASLGPTTAVVEAVYAVCAKQQPRYEQASLQASPNGVASQDIYCTGGEVVGGGTSGHEYVRERSSYPFDDPLESGWSFAADNASSEPRDITGYAICADVDVQLVESSATPVDAAEQGQSGSDCGSAGQVVGGGIQALGAQDQALIAGSRPRPGVESWESRVDAYAASSFVTWAVCVPLPD